MLLGFLSDVLRELRDLPFAWKCEEHRSINRRNSALPMLATFPCIVRMFPVANSLAHITGIARERGLGHMQDGAQSLPLSDYPFECREDFQRLWINDLR